MYDAVYLLNERDVSSTPCENETSLLRVRHLFNPNIVFEIGYIPAAVPKYMSQRIKHTKSDE